MEEFLRRDPLREYRDRVDAARLAKKPDDCMNVLDEHHRHARLLREKLSGELAETRKLADAYRREFEQERAQGKTLERLLNECRASFEATDRALTEARAVVDDLNETVVPLRHENLEVRQQLQEQQMRCASLSDHIRNMEQSRSWRYTAWLRRK
ncbi:MAG: hypothetical protein U5K56_06955 [Halioglobus sp.]|nr:hypothetical protein [Halioglobus sp.]